MGTDLRGEIFALVGLASDEVVVEPDYARPVQDVYRDVTGQLVVQERSLALLSMVEDVAERAGWGVVVLGAGLYLLAVECPFRFS